MRATSFFALFTLAFTATTVHAEESAPAGMPAWLAGHWCSQAATEQGEEYWWPAAGGMMMGMSRSVATGKKTQFEFLRIETIDRVPTYIALPQGKGETAFPRTGGGQFWVRFENPAHDFPQRIEYRRSGDALQAKIAGPGEKSKALVMSFEFRRCDD